MGEICGGDQRPRRHVSGSLPSIRLRTLLAPTTPTALSFRGPKAKKNFPLSPIGAAFLISTLGTLISNKSACSSDCRSSISSTDYSAFSLRDAACFIPGFHVSILFSTGSTNPPRRKTSWIHRSSSVNIRRSRCFCSTNSVTTARSAALLVLSAAI
ncbi:hypothetical protein OROMI_007545 [Orobanche minor]